ncbi:hypothetical protein CCR97_28765 [Rhodoplanes elegans]|uniref:Uncharacterized protein n=1 Tax=Rhodoplanes elegans TaxID=29408 RepID=A0A327K440_9BRAD|nr:hypothetical protein [Rhodoplanes elegans]RAI32644.1 hypothetical protein CH338_23815 [Rhodoplanes elegans]
MLRGAVSAGAGAALSEKLGQAGPQSASDDARLSGRGSRAGRVSRAGMVAGAAIEGMLPVMSGSAAGDDGCARLSCVAETSAVGDGCARRGSTVEPAGRASVPSDGRLGQRGPGSQTVASPVGSDGSRGHSAAAAGPSVKRGTETTRVANAVAARNERPLSPVTPGSLCLREQGTI